MKTLLTVSVMAAALAMLPNSAMATLPDCNSVCTCAMPCSTVCTVFGSSQSATCESAGLACMESCPDDKLDLLFSWLFGRYSDEELVCR
ncbi:MAG TPA: hypothetical protein PK156_21555 [Polyangium sp.]|nr:hypothetical protein [Polyangium sp.]